MWAQALVNSDVVVTGIHGSYNEHLSTHAAGFLLAFAIWRSSAAEGQCLIELLQCDNHVA